MKIAFAFISAAAAGITFSASLAFAQSWPDLAKPAPAVGGGAHDAAVIVAIENYAFVAPVPGAKENANAWYDYFIKTRRIPFRNVFRRVDSDVTAEDINRLAARAANSAGKDGTLWFVFIGHGAPSADGKDGLLVGVDAQQKAESLEARGLSQRKLLATLAKSQAGTIVAVIDACFSGRGVEGTRLVAGLQPLVVTQDQAPEDPRLVVMTAAQGNEFAGQLPGAQRPAFSYLTLGGLRGWADDTGGGDITGAEVQAYADSVLRTMVTDRTQTPVLMGDGQKLLARSAGEKGPDLVALANEMAPERHGSNRAISPPFAKETRTGNDADSASRRGALNLDVNYPGVGVRYFLSDKTAIEGRAQYDKDASVAGARLYWYPPLLPAGSKFSPYLCAEGGYGSFKSVVTKGAGFAGGAFGGIEYSLSRSFSLQMDAGGEYISLKDKGASVTQNELEFILNFGVNFYIKSGSIPASESVDEGNGRRADSEYRRVRERAQAADQELDRNTPLIGP